MRSGPHLTHTILLEAMLEAGSKHWLVDPAHKPTEYLRPVAFVPWPERPRVVPPFPPAPVELAMVTIGDQPMIAGGFIVHPSAHDEEWPISWGIISAQRPLRVLVRAAYGRAWFRCAIECYPLEVPDAR